MSHSQWRSNTHNSPLDCNQSTIENDHQAPPIDTASEYIPYSFSSGEHAKQVTIHNYYNYIPQHFHIQNITTHSSLLTLSIHVDSSHIHQLAHHDPYQQYRETGIPCMSILPYPNRQYHYEEETGHGEECGQHGASSTDETHHRQGVATTLPQAKKMIYRRTPATRLSSPITHSSSSLQSYGTRLHRIISPVHLVSVYMSEKHSYTGDYEKYLYDKYQKVVEQMKSNLICHQLIVFTRTMYQVCPSHFIQSSHILKGSHVVSDMHASAMGHAAYSPITTTHPSFDFYCGCNRAAPPAIDEIAGYMIPPSLVFQLSPQDKLYALRHNMHPPISTYHNSHTYLFGDDHAFKDSRERWIALCL